VPGSTTALLLALDDTTTMDHYQALLLPILAGLAKHRQSLIQLSHMKETQNQLERSEKLQHALFTIADLASADIAMEAMLKGLHDVISHLMYAGNFFIVRNDPARGGARYIHYVDSRDDNPPTPDDVF